MDNKLLWEQHNTESARANQNAGWSVAGLPISRNAAEGANGDVQVKNNNVLGNITNFKINDLGFEERLGVPRAIEIYDKDTTGAFDGGISTVAALTFAFTGTAGGGAWSFSNGLFGLLDGEAHRINAEVIAKSNDHTQVLYTNITFIVKRVAGVNTIVYGPAPVLQGNYTNLNVDIVQSAESILFTVSNGGGVGAVLAGKVSAFITHKKLNNT